MGPDSSNRIIITKTSSNNNYCGNGDLLSSLNIPFNGLEKSLEFYESELINNVAK